MLSGVAPALLQAALGVAFMRDSSGATSTSRAFDTSLQFALLFQPIYLFAWSLFVFRRSSLPIGWRIFWAFPITFGMSMANLIAGTIGCAVVAGQ